MSSSDLSNDELVFSSQIEVVLLIEECCFDEIIEYIFQHILFMQLCKNNDDDVILIDLANMIEFRFVIIIIIIIIIMNLTADQSCSHVVSFTAVDF